MQDLNREELLSLCTLLAEQNLALSDALAQQVARSVQLEDQLIERDHQIDRLKRLIVSATNQLAQFTLKNCEAA